MRCAACDSENAPGRKFCANCGAALGIVCPACGHANSATDRFCGECGGALATLPATPRPAESDGELRPAVILFADLSGYTSHSGAADPEDVQGLLNRFFQRADQIIVEAGGTVDKHIGDCVMAVFGAPVAHDDDAARACRAARQILDSGESGAGLKVHGGIAMGQVFAGKTGSTHHGNYTVTGAAVNLAARLCDLASPGEVLVTESVATSTSSRFEFSAIRNFEVDGYSETVAAAFLGRPVTQATAQGASIFVGRERELRQLSNIVEGVIESRRGQVVEIVGQAGIGKSRLIERFTRLAQQRNLRVKAAAISSMASGRGADATRMLMRALVSPADGAGSQQDVTKIAADFDLTGEQTVFVHELLDLPIPPKDAGYYDALGQEARRSARAGLLRALATPASEQTPALLVIEDIHWAERDSILEIGSFASMIAELPVLLLMTSRPEDDPVNRTWRNIALPTPFAAFDLPPLAADESVKLARLLGSNGEFAAIVKRAEGNPLFLTQLIRHTRDLEGADMPGSIRSVVVARLDRLDQAARRAAQSAAVLGTRFTRLQLAHLLDAPAVEINRLVDAQFIRPAGDQFEFTHALVRDAAYGTLPKSRRLQLHSRAAQWFADKEIALEALHLENAQDPRAARKYFEAAALAVQQFRNALAETYNAKGLHLAERKEDRIALQIQRSEILEESGQISAAIDSWRKALELGASPTETCQIEIGLAQSLRIVDSVDEAAAALDRAQLIAGPLGLNLELSRLNFVRGNLFFSQGRIDKCLEAHGRALEHAGRAESIEAECRAYGGMGDAYYAMGKIRSARDAFDRCVKLARQHGFGRIEVANLPMLATTAHIAGFTEQAEVVLSEALALARRTAAIRAEMITLQIQWLMVAESHDTKLARSLLDRSWEIAAKLGAVKFQAENRAFYACTELLEGHRAKALQQGREAWKLAEQSGRAFIGPIALGMIAIATEDNRERHEALREARDLLNSGSISHNHFFFNRRIISDALERGEFELVETCCRAFEDYTAGEPLPWSDCWIRFGRAMLRGKRGDSGGDLAGELRELKVEAERLGFARMAGELAGASRSLESSG